MLFEVDENNEKAVPKLITFGTAFFYETFISVT